MIRMKLGLPFLIFAILISQTTNVMSQMSSSDYYVAYDLSFSTRVTNEGSSAFDLSSNRLTAPVVFLPRNSTSQITRLVSSNPALAVTSDQDGNSIGIFQIEKRLEPKQTAVMETRFKAFERLTATRRFEWSPSLEDPSSGTTNEIPKELIEKYQVSASSWKTNGTNVSWAPIRELAFRLAGNETNALKIVARLIDWVGQNTKITTAKRDRILFPNETLTTHEGTSDEQANLIISLCRTLAIPAHLQCGYVYLPSGTNTASMYGGHLSLHSDRITWHAWAMVYVPPWGWVPVDMTMGYSEADPLQAIFAAAPQTLSTVISNDYFLQDYVAEVNRDSMQLGRLSVQIEHDESMALIEISPQYRASSNVNTTTAVLIGFGAIILVTYMILRTRHRHQMNP
jgi:transglutaminase-like putative cysteine protease